jgi:hypothetical protein
MSMKWIPLALTLLWSLDATAQQRYRRTQQPGEETIQEIEIQETSPFKDAFHLRMNAGAAYARWITRYEPSDGNGDKQSLNTHSPALHLEAGVGLRLGRDVSLGILGGAIHGPVTNLEGEWSESYQGAYYGLLFMDHHFPHQRTVHMGVAVGPGFVHSVGPDEQGYGAWGPVGQAFFGFDLRMGKTIRFGILGTLTGASVKETHAIAGNDQDFDTFFIAIGAAFTVRVADFKFPTSMPTLARRCTTPSCASSVR